LKALAFYGETSQASIVRALIEEEISRAKAAGWFKPKEATHDPDKRKPRRWPPSGLRENRRKVNV